MVKSAKRRHLAAARPAGKLFSRSAQARTLIYLKGSNDQSPEAFRNKPVLREEQNDQIDCCCGLRLVRCNVGASYDACTDSSDA
jgi:hypothetical protein